MECIRCHNTNPIYFYKDKDEYYCRKCIAFGRINVQEKPIAKKYKTRQWKVHYHLDYALTSYQKKAIQKVNIYLKKKEDVLVYAATGAGKTEITMQSIENYLNAGKKVGIAISRRQVVLEICERMQTAFSSLKVIAVCEGHTKVVDGDIIVCTMHQLYRYYQTFDLLIMDEVDAFPYRGNDVLEAIAHHSCKGQIIYLTATPDEKMLKMVEENALKMVTLFKRPHGYPLIVPRCVKLPSLFQLIYLLKFLNEQHTLKKQTLVFVPTIHMANRLESILSFFYPCASLTSKTRNKDEIAQKMRDKKYEFLIATTILERGITIPGVDVVVLYADHIVFNEASLIQIAGRVGRSMKMPIGKCVFLYEKKNKEIHRCVAAIERMNAS